jgi:hypothetical protein
MATAIFAAAAAAAPPLFIYSNEKTQNMVD